MQRIEGTRKEHVLLICMTLAAVAVTFPLAAPEKTLTLVAYFGFSAVALLLAVTRLRVLALPALISYFIFAASFLAPVEIAVVRGNSLSASWVRCIVVSGLQFIDRATTADYVIDRGCCPINGVEPSWVLKISIPK